MSYIFKIRLVIVCLFISGSQVMGQSVESILNEKSNCFRLEVAILNALPKFYDKGMYDSIYLLVSYGRHFCPGNGVYNLLHNLLLIHYGRPVDTVFTQADILVLAQDVRKMKIYRRSAEKLQSKEWTDIEFNNRARYHRGKYPHDEWALMEMIQKWADVLLPYQKEGSQEALFCNLLSGELGHMIRWVYREPYKQSAISKGYARYHFDEVLNRAFYQEFSSGLSIPASAYMNTLLGSRIHLSYSIGYRKKMNRYDWSIGWRTGRDTREPFVVNRPDTVFFSNKAYNFSTGFQYARKISGLHSRWEWNALAGVLMEFWDHVPGVDTRDDEGNEIPGLVAVENKIKPYTLFGMFPQVGVETKYFARSGSAVGLSLKYQYVNYFNNRTEMGGSMFLLSFHWCTFTGGLW